MARELALVACLVGVKRTIRLGVLAEPAAGRAARSSCRRRQSRAVFTSWRGEAGFTMRRKSSGYWFPHRTRRAAVEPVAAASVIRGSVKRREHGRMLAFEPQLLRACNLSRYIECRRGGCMICFRRHQQTGQHKMRTRIALRFQRSLRYHATHALARGTRFGANMGASTLAGEASSVVAKNYSLA